MKYSKLGFLFLSAVLVGGTMFPRTAQADPSISFDFFYDSLDPYGEWADLPDYGLCWHPKNVDEDWAPYTDGYWANTDAGWTWVSYEDWGGITYHYGRWAKIPAEGWFWVPDYEWAPAWVSWRTSDDYVGWAPLPPAARWEPTVGFSFWVDSYCDIGPSYYNFCEVRNFGSPALRPVIIDRRQNVTIINRTTNITNITINRNTNIVYNGGPDYNAMSRRSLRPIQTLKLHQQRDVGDFRNNRGQMMSQQRGNELFVVAPRVDAPSNKFRPARTARVLPRTTIDTGWAGVSDPKVRTELHAKIKQESKNVTPQQAPASAPSEKDLQGFQQRLKTQPAKPASNLIAPAIDPGNAPKGRHPSGIQGAPVENQVRSNPGSPAGVESPVSTPGLNATPAPGKQGKRGNHGEVVRPVPQPEQVQETSRPAVDPQKQIIEKQPRVQDQNPRKQQQAPSEQLQRDTQPDQAQQAQRAQQDQQRAQDKARQKDLQEAQSQQRQQAQRVQEQQQQAQRAQQQQQQQALKAAQEQQLQQRAQESQQRRVEQAQRPQEQNIRQQKDRPEVQQRQVEQPRRQVERPQVQQQQVEQPRRQVERPQVQQQQQQQSSSTPQGSPTGHGKKNSKDKDPDQDR